MFHKPALINSKAKDFLKGFTWLNTDRPLSLDGRTLAISDSNHNRVVVADAGTGKIVHKVGGDAKGLRDGSFGDTLFFRPQGVLWVGEKIYVADTENHALSEIDLQSRAVRTLAVKE